LLLSAALAVLAASFVSHGSSAQVRGQGSRPFSRTEQHVLDTGGLVVRSVTKQRGSLRLVGGASWQVINLPPEAVFRAVLDADRYPRMLPRVVESHVVARHGTERIVLVRHAAGPVAARYYLRTNVYQDRKDLTFTLDERRPHDIRAAWGFFAVRPYRNGKSVLSYGVMTDIGEGVVTGLFRGQVHEWILRVPWTIKKYIEGRGRQRYLVASR